MLGTIVNCVAVAVGGTIGLLFRKVIKEDHMKGVNLSLGLAIFIIGMNGITSYMVTSKDGILSSSGELLLVVFIVIGTLIGEMLRLEGHFENFCGNIEKKFKAGGFASGFINGTVIFNVGAMAIVGSIADGINNDHSILFVKSALDFVSSVIFGATLGYGVIFSFITILIYQGGITLLAGSLNGLLQGELLNQICFVGYAVIMAIGINFIFGKKFKTLNMIPAIFLPVIYHYILVLIEVIKNI